MLNDVSRVCYNQLLIFNRLTSEQPKPCAWYFGSAYLDKALSFLNYDAVFALVALGISVVAEARLADAWLAFS